MTLKQLEAFYWAVVSSNFVVAAARLHVSQSTLSKRIVELEARIGQPLFDRSGQRAVPTEAAQALLPLARRMLRMAEEMRTMFRGEQWLRGHCRFGVGEFSALTWLPDFVAYSRAAWPEVVLEPFVDLGAALEERLDAGELDFAVIAGLSSRTALSGETIGKVHFSWGASPEVVGSRRSVSAELLQDVTLITMPPGAGATRVLDQWLATYDIEVGRRVTCNNLAAIAGLVAAGVGISLFPRGWLDRMIDRDAVVEMRSPHPLPALSYTFQYRRGDTRLLLRHMRQAVAATVDFSKPHALW